MKLFSRLSSFLKILWGASDEYNNYFEFRFTHLLIQILLPPTYDYDYEEILTAVLI